MRCRRREAPRRVQYQSMLRTLLKSKIHGGLVTATRLHYRGSITIASEVMMAANLVADEQVHVLNLNTGDRFETYVIPGKRGSRALELNGPAARLGQVGDPLIILAYGLYPDGESSRPQIVLLGPGNRPIRKPSARRRRVS